MLRVPDFGLTARPKTYLVRYARNPDTDGCSQYLPGRAYDGYRQNIGLIIRDGQDGRWHRAVPEWAGLLNGYLLRG